MRHFVPSQFVWWLALVSGLLIGQRVEAQGFGLSVTTAASVVVQPNAVVYTINVTNRTGVALTNVYVVNTFSDGGYRQASSSSQGTNSIISSSVVFALGAMTNGGWAVMTLAFEPDSAGLLTNRVTVGSVEVTNTAALDRVTTVVSPATAQGFGFSATTSTNLVVLTNSLTYTFNLTNLTGILLTNVYLTNTLWTGGTLDSRTNSQGSNSVVASGLVFSLGTMTNKGTASMAFTFRPNAAGELTNTVTVVASGVTNGFAINVVTLVVNSYADLGVNLTGPAQAVIVGDWMTYPVTVTNLGPGSAANVMLTNTLPVGVLLKSVSPSPGYTVSGNSQIFSLGTLASGAQKTFYFTVQPTNAAALTFSAAVGAVDLEDPDPDNNEAGTNVAVINYPVGTLVAVTNSAPAINWQNGLTEQFIQLTNAGTNDVTAARVVVTGLTNRLFNAVGTNSGNPFVYYSAPLAAGQSVRLLLQFQPRGTFPFTNGQLHAFAVPLPGWTPPKATGTSTNINISRILKLTNGVVLIEFPSVAGNSYTVVYSDNVSFTNAQVAPPSIVAPANRTQWLDYGPPTTTNAPANASMRFYRVFQNP